MPNEDEQKISNGVTNEGKKPQEEAASTMEDDVEARAESAAT